MQPLDDPAIHHGRVEEHYVLGGGRWKALPEVRGVVVPLLIPPLGAAPLHGLGGLRAQRRHRGTGLLFQRQAVVLEETCGAKFDSSVRPLLSVEEGVHGALEGQLQVRTPRCARREDVRVLVAVAQTDELRHDGHPPEDPPEREEVHCHVRIECHQPEVRFELGARSAGIQQLQGDRTVVRDEAIVTGVHEVGLRVGAPEVGLPEAVHLARVPSRIEGGVHRDGGLPHLLVVLLHEVNMAVRHDRHREGPRVQPPLHGREDPLGARQHLQGVGTLRDQVDQALLVRHVVQHRALQVVVRWSRHLEHVVDEGVHESDRSLVCPQEEDACIVRNSVRVPVGVPTSGPPPWPSLRGEVVRPVPDGGRPALVVARRQAVDRNQQVCQRLRVEVSPRVAEPGHVNVREEHIAAPLQHALHDLQAQKLGDAHAREMQALGLHGLFQPLCISLFHRHLHPPAKFDRLRV